MPNYRITSLRDGKFLAKVTGAKDDRDALNSFRPGGIHIDLVTEEVQDSLPFEVWKPMARYGSKATLTYVEEAPVGRGPWFVAGVIDVVEFADYDEALSFWKAAEGKKK
jgi:hypothetical protein